MLGVCLQLTHAEFIGALRQLLSPAGGGAPSWQTFELVFFVTRCLHVDLKTVLNSNGDGSALPPPLLEAHKEVRTVALERPRAWHRGSSLWRSLVRSLVAPPHPRARSSLVVPGGQGFARAAAGARRR